MKGLLLIFDFDNTLEEFSVFEDSVEREIFTKIAAKHSLEADKMQQVFDAIKLAYANPRAHPQDYGRAVWFSETFHIFHIHEDVQAWVAYYWDLMFSLVRVFPGTYQTLEELREHHTLCILSDSDGDASIKLRRIEHLGLLKYFDHVFTSDSAGHNKPHPAQFLQVLNHYHVAAEECVMIGDMPHLDLVTAKELGMHTVWQKQRYSAKPATHYGYVDYEIDMISELPMVIENLSHREAAITMTTSRE